MAKFYFFQLKFYPPIIALLLLFFWDDNFFTFQLLYWFIRKLLHVQNFVLKKMYVNNHFV